MNNIVLIRKLQELKERNNIIDIEYNRLIELLQVEERTKDYYASEKKALSAIKKVLKSKNNNNKAMKIMAEYDLGRAFDYKFQGKPIYVCLNGHVLFGVTKKYEGLPYMHELTDVQRADLDLTKSEAEGLQPFHVERMLPNDFSEYKSYNYSVKDIMVDARLTDKKNVKPYILKDLASKTLAGVNIFYLQGAIEAMQVEGDVQLWIKDSISPIWIVNDKGFALILPINIKGFETENNKSIREKL